MTRVLLIAAYISTIWLANWSLDHYGFVSVGFGLVAPAGVFFAGIALTLRDAVQHTSGRTWVVVAILTGALVSWWVSPTFAVASATAFLVSEFADYGVYTPIADRRPALAILASNTVGAVVDSAIFLYLAFGSLDHITGQIVGKLWATLPFVLVVAAYGRRRRAAVAC